MSTVKTICCLSCKTRNFSILFASSDLIKICDFDLAREWKESKPKTMSGRGTYPYMAPERFPKDHSCFQVGLMFERLC